MKENLIIVLNVEKPDKKHKNVDGIIIEDGTIAIPDTKKETPGRADGATTMIEGMQIIITNGEM